MGAPAEPQKPAEHAAPKCRGRKAVGESLFKEGASQTYDTSSLILFYVVNVKWGIVFS